MNEIEPMTTGGIIGLICFVIFGILFNVGIIWLTVYGIVKIIKKVFEK